MIVDLADLGLDEGAQLLIDRALRAHDRIEVRGRAASLPVDLPAWCRARGHGLARSGEAFTITRSPHDRWAGAERAGSVDAPAEHALARWGLAARGAFVEAGMPDLHFALSQRRDVWSDDVARMYAH